MEEPDLWQALGSGLFLGDEEFEKRCLVKLNPFADLSEVRRAQRHHRSPISFNVSRAVTQR